MLLQFAILHAIDWIERSYLFRRLFDDYFHCRPILKFRLQFSHFCRYIRISIRQLEALEFLFLFYRPTNHILFHCKFRDNLLCKQSSQIKINQYVCTIKIVHSSKIQFVTQNMKHFSIRLPEHFCACHICNGNHCI